MGVIIGTFNSNHFPNLHMTDFSTVEPTARRITVDVPGRDGLLDLSEYAGKLSYSNRTLTIQLEGVMFINDFRDIQAELSRTVHDQECKIVLEYDREFYYVGRVSVSSSMSNPMHAVFTFTCDCEPYKYREHITSLSYDVEGERLLNIFNLHQKVIPTISVDADMSIEFNGMEFSLEKGNTYRTADILFDKGFNELKCVGNGNIIVEFREGTI